MISTILKRNMMLSKNSTAFDMNSSVPLNAFNVKPIQASGNSARVPARGSSGL
jgi:hypothetical protein